MGRLEPQAEWESRLVVKVCNLCRVLETGISAVLAVMNSLGSSSIRRTMVTFVMMINNGDYNSDLVFPLGGSASG